MTPIAIAVMAILIIGAEMLLLYFLALISRLAIKNSKFKTLPMFLRFFKNTFLFLLFGIVSCGRSTGQNGSIFSQKEAGSATSEIIGKASGEIIVGANRTAEYLPLLEGKRVGIVANQSTVIFAEEEQEKFTHLVDSLMERNVNLVKVFAPEHGFRGTADAGETIKDGKDSKTGLPIISLYGDNKKPGADQLKGIDILLFDLQDVGARFYTYISTLHYVMEAAAENNIPLLILDRPNPNGHYVDGPVLDPAYSSFVGMHPVPVVHGLTIGEYGKMINGEKWLKNGIQTDLKVIEMENYDHSKRYNLPVKPSPNLPNEQAVNLYPSLCFFEGTNVNAGRGTDDQFQVFGSPFLSKDYFNYTYTPESKPGAKSPKHLGKTCYGKNLTDHPYLDKIDLSWLIEAYYHTANKKEFFNNFFTNLAGGPTLRKQIEQGLTEEDIRKTWEKGIQDFKEKRRIYLLYN